MASTPQQAEALRELATGAIQRTTQLIADLQALADGLATLLPEEGERTERERWRDAARLGGIDATTLERLEAGVEARADVVAGLTSADNGARWRTQRLTRLAAGEEDAAAA
jgi:hypothetical protein